MKERTWNKLILFFLILTNFLLFFLLGSIWYMAKQTKHFFQSQADNLNQQVEKKLENLTNLGQIKDNLTNLAQISEKFDVEHVRKEIKQLSDNIGKLDDIKQKLVSLGDNITSELRVNLKPMAELNQNLERIKTNLDRLKEIENNLGGLSNLEGIGDKVDNLEGIKSNLGNLNLNKLEKELASLGEEGKKMIDELSKNANSIICSECGKQKVIKSSQLGLIQINDLIVKEEIWKKWIKNDKLILKYKEKKPILFGATWMWSNKKKLDKKNMTPQELEKLRNECQAKDEKDYEIFLEDSEYICPGKDCRYKIKKMEKLENHSLRNIINELF